MRLPRFEFRNIFLIDWYSTLDASESESLESSSEVDDITTIFSFRRLRCLLATVFVIFDLLAFRLVLISTALCNFFRRRSASLRRCFSQLAIYHSWKSII